MEPAQNQAHTQEHEIRNRPFCKTMETLQNIWKAIDDSGVLWMFEAVWPALQALGVLLAIVVFGIAWLWLANAGGDDDEEVEDSGVPVFGLTPEYEKMAQKEDEERHRAAMLLNMYPDAAEGRWFRKYDDGFSS